MFALIGRVVKLDRGYPLVRVEEGEEYRCEYATTLIKNQKTRAVIGDVVSIVVPDGHDKAIIEKVHQRKNKLVRKDPTEQAIPQVLAANFDSVFITQSLGDINFKRLERELVLAHETGAEVVVLLTKADLVTDEKTLEETERIVRDLVGNDQVLIISAENEKSVEAVRALVPSGHMAVLMGKSGVGKSSLINLLVGKPLQKTAEVRKGDGKGRHTTVSRTIVEIPGGGFMVDMPGVRGLGLWDADMGIGEAFSDIEHLADSCKFRDCHHENEPGCAVLEAVERGTLALSRVRSYRTLKQETSEMQERREEATRMQIKTGSSRSHSLRRNTHAKK